MKLYFVSHDNDDGENMDWFAVAHDRNQAVSLWRSYNAVEPGIKEGPTRVFEVRLLKPADLYDKYPVPRLLDWENDVRQVRP